MKIFKASIDNFSAFASLFVIGLSVSLFLGLFNSGNQLSIIGISIGTILNFFVLLLVLTFFLLRTTSYTVSESAIIINSLLLPYIINRNEIASIAIVSKADMSGVYRTFGNGGLFGYTGYYRNAKFGTMRWFATQRKNYVLIEKTDGKKIVITPDEPENFINALG